jgi:hypothetical protein
LGSQTEAHRHDHGDYYPEEYLFHHDGPAKSRLLATNDSHRRGDRPVALVLTSLFCQQGELPLAPTSDIVNFYLKRTFYRGIVHDRFSLIQDPF